MNQLFLNENSNSKLEKDNEQKGIIRFMETTEKNIIFPEKFLKIEYKF